MPTKAYNIRIDEELKRDMDEVASEIGLTSAACFNVFAKRFVAERGFPFEVKAPRYVPFRSEEEAVEFADAMYEEVMADESW